MLATTFTNVLLDSRTARALAGDVRAVRRSGDLRSTDDVPALERAFFRLENTASAEGWHMLPEAIRVPSVTDAYVDLCLSDPDVAACIETERCDTVALRELALKLATLADALDAERG